MKLVITALFNVLYVSQCGVLEIRTAVTGTCSMVAASPAAVSMSQYRPVTWISTQFMLTICRQTDWHKYNTCVYVQLEQLRPSHSVLIGYGQWFYCHWPLHMESAYIVHSVEGIVWRVHKRLGVGLYRKIRIRRTLVCTKSSSTCVADVMFVIVEQVEREYASCMQQCTVCAICLYCTHAMPVCWCGLGVIQNWKRMLHMCWVLSCEVVREAKQSAMLGWCVQGNAHVHYRHKFSMIPLPTKVADELAQLMRAKSCHLCIDMISTTNNLPLPLNSYIRTYVHGIWLYSTYSHDWVLYCKALSHTDECLL